MTKTINYEKAFKELVKQINDELAEANKDVVSLSWMLDTNPKKVFCKGKVTSLYKIAALAEKLEDGTYFNNEED